jgi:hypothetical protein
LFLFLYVFPVYVSFFLSFFLHSFQFERWQSAVMGKEGMVLEMTESLRQNTPEMVFLLFVWYLIYSSMGNLKTLWCFRNFLFYQTVKLRKDSMTSGLPIGKVRTLFSVQVYNSLSHLTSPSRFLVDY